MFIVKYHTGRFNVFRSPVTLQRHFDVSIPINPSRAQGIGKTLLQESPEIRRRLLIEAAERCLAAHGIQGFTIDRICANVSRGLISHYFAGKDELLAAVYRSALYGAIMGQVTVAGGATPLLRLRAAIDAAFQPETFSAPTSACGSRWGAR